MADWVDWQKPFSKVFETLPIKKVVEYGLGDGTEWLLDHADSVISIEFSARDEHNEWTQKMKDKYKDRTNWVAHLVPTEDSYTDLVKEWVSKFQDADLFFVDSGIHCRGKIVEQLMNEGAPIISAHDTNYGNEAYGWSEIQMAPGYSKYHSAEGEGTTFWIKDHNVYEKITKAFTA